MTKNAFFYDGRYFLLPDDCASVDELNEKHRDGVSFTVTELREKKCMAPYFVVENTKEKTLKLKKKAPVFPVTVELMTQQAYNRKLREIVPGFCAKCPNYGEIDETDGSLDGHHEEISLDGVCLTCPAIKDKYDDYKPMDRWLKNAVRDLGSYGIMNHMAALLDEGKNDEAADLFVRAVLARILEPLPCVWADKQENGQYRIIFSSLQDTETGLVTDYIFEALRKKYGRTWDFVSGIPAGFMLPEAVKPTYLTAGLQESPRPYANLTVYYPDTPGGQADYGAYLWLCGYYGEAYLRSNILAYEFKPVEGDRPEDAVEPDDPAFADLLEKLAANDADEAAGLYPPAHILPEFPVDLPEDASDEEAARAFVLSSFRAENLALRFVSPVAWGEEPQNVWDGTDVVSEMKMPLARLVFRRTFDNFPGEISKQDEQMMNAVADMSTYLLDHRLSVKAAQRISYGGAELWSVVLNLKDYMYAIRHFAPLFDKYPADLYIYTASGKNGGHFKPGFMMKRVETEGKLRKKLKSAQE